MATLKRITKLCLVRKKKKSQLIRVKKCLEAETILSGNSLKKLTVTLVSTRRFTFVYLSYFKENDNDMTYWF